MADELHEPSYATGVLELPIQSFDGADLRLSFYGDPG
jgi:hypothetical protein